MPLNNPPPNKKPDVPPSAQKKNTYCNYELMERLKEESQKKYLHTDCGWISTEEEMHADYSGDNLWSNWICPRCGDWLQLSDYVIVYVLKLPCPTSPLGSS